MCSYAAEQEHEAKVRTKSYFVKVRNTSKWLKKRGSD